MIYINLVSEDDLSEIVMSQILSQFQNKFEIAQTYSNAGFGFLKKRIRAFNQASKISPYFMLTDLDNYECPLELIHAWIDFPINSNFIFRIAVREVEAWLLADRDGLSQYLKVPKNIFPRQPDLEKDPKTTLIQLAKRSRSRRIREDIVPINENAKIGPNYTDV